MRNRYMENIFYHYRKICTIFLVLSVLLTGLILGPFAFAQNNNVQISILSQTIQLSSSQLTFKINVFTEGDIADLNLGSRYGTSSTAITETGALFRSSDDPPEQFIVSFKPGISLTPDTKYYYKIINTQTNEVYLSDSFTTDPAGTITGPGDGTITGPGTGITVQLDNPLTVKTLNEFIKAILDIVLTIGIPIVALAIIYSGFLFVTARGDPERLKKAKDTFLWVIIGAAILLGAWVLAQAIGGTIEEIRRAQ